MYLSIPALSTEANCISYVLLFLTQHVLQASLLLILKFIYLFLKVLVPHLDVSNVHLGYASELQVYN